MHPNLDYTVVAVDFDGTLTMNSEYPEIGEPNELLIDFLKTYKKNGNKLILWTCRTGKELDSAVEMCAEYGLLFDAVNENIVDFPTSNKIYADIYIDDRALFVNDLMKDLFSAIEESQRG